MSVLQISELHAATVAKYYGVPDVMGFHSTRTIDDIRGDYIDILTANQHALANRYGDEPQSVDFILAGFDDAYKKATKPSPAQYAKLCDCIVSNIDDASDLLVARYRYWSKRALIHAAGTEYAKAHWTI